MTLDDWLEGETQDAARRGLVGLKPLLETLARSTAALRRAADDRLPSAGGSTPRDPD